MPICSTCKADKSSDEFSWKVKNVRRHARCKECSRKVDSAYYQQNSARRDSIRQRSKNARQEIKDWILTYLSEHPCECGETRLPCLHFHHRDPSDKKHAISEMEFFSLQSVKDEVAKCTVMCANCHAVETAKQFGYSKFGRLANVVNAAV